MSLQASCLSASVQAWRWQVLISGNLPEHIHICSGESSQTLRQCRPLQQERTASASEEELMNEQPVNTQPEDTQAEDDQEMSAQPENAQPENAQPVYGQQMYDSR